MSTAVLERPTFETDLWDDEELSSELELVSPLEALSGSDEGRESELREDSSKMLFDELADELAEATRGLSSTRRASRHPAYQEILALGDETVPWLLARLETGEDRPLWLRLLASLNHFQPGAGQNTIGEAASAWIAWGKLRNSR